MLAALAEDSKARSFKAVPSCDGDMTGIGLLRILFDRDADGVLQCVGHVFAPFDSAHAAAGQIILPPDIEQLVRRGQAVHIKMEQRQPPGEIFVDDGIGRACHIVFNAEAARNAAGQSGLARAEVAKVGNDVAGTEALCQLFSQRLRFVRAVRGDLQRKAPLPTPFYLWQYTIPGR